jgi:hypothetical protein
MEKIRKRIQSHLPNNAFIIDFEIIPIEVKRHGEAPEKVRVIYKIEEEYYTTILKLKGYKMIYRGVGITLLHARNIYQAYRGNVYFGSSKDLEKLKQKIDERLDNGK